MEKEKSLYSDGDIEDVIIQSLDAGNDVSGYKNGAVFHNFTDARENLINWYPFKEDASVLEIGAGMGALTGILCNQCKNVVSLEQSPKRADIIRKRHRNEENLQVICDDIYEHSFTEEFDYILLIGVLEYVGINSDDDDPYTKILARINELLKPDGKLLLAIENQYGLKYWCGAAEDHTGIPFDGISGYDSKGYTTRYNNVGVRTFSRNVLKDLLQRCGFQQQRWYYPLPDYKFPMAIFSDGYLPQESDIESIKFSYPIESVLIANEKNIYKEVISNGVFPFFSNSFFVEASAEKMEESYVMYASLKRDYKMEYRIATLITSQKEVIKQCIHEGSFAHLHKIIYNIKNLRQKGISILEGRIDNNRIVQEWQDMQRADAVFMHYIKTGNTEKAFAMIRMLEENLKKSSDLYRSKNCKAFMTVNLVFGEEEEILIDGYIDMTFLNSFFDGEKLIFFDQEWKYSDVPLKYILYRAVKYAYKKVGKISLSILYHYIGVNEDMARQFDSIEQQMLLGMMDDQKCEWFDPGMYHEGLTLQYKWEQLRKNGEHIEEERDQLQEICQEKERIILNQNRVLEEKDQIILSQNRVLEEKDQIILGQNRVLEEKEQALANKKAHIEQLLQSERDLNAHLKLINDSRVFRIVRLLWKINAVLFPIGSRRRALLRKIRHPFGGGAKPVNYGAGGDTGTNKSLEEYEPIRFPEWEKPLVSIVIPVYNEFDYTYGCLRSILENSGDIPYEIILADDCSTDLTKEIRKVVSHIVIARTEENVRFLLNCNQAAKRAKGDYILFLNNDTEVHDNWLEPLVALMESDDTIGMSGSKLVYADGTLQEAGGIIWQDGSGWNYGNGQDASLPEFNYVKDVDYISGAAIMIRRDLWESIGGFDERYVPAYCEDSDLAFEVRKCGYRVVYQPASVVTHFEGISNGTDLTEGVKQYQVDNSRKLREKWKEELDRQYPNAVNVFRARERSRDRKIVLFIDHYVPHFDEDAGSKTVYQYLKMFVEKGYIVKFIGDNYYRHEPYTTVLQQMGIEVLYGPYYAQHSRNWIRDNKSGIDIAFLNRPHISEKYIDLIHNECGIKTIYYGHDLHFLRIRREYELTGDREKKKQSEEWMQRELKLMRTADLSYYPSYVEEQEVHKIDAAIRVKAITAYVFDYLHEAGDRDVSDCRDIMFVGGFRHDPNVDAVLWFLDKIWPLIHKERDIRFNIVGSHAPEEIKAFHGKDGIVVKGFVSDEELDRLYAECRIVVVPLRYGAGVKGKVVEALYHGAAIVTTSVGAEGIRGIAKAAVIADKPENFAAEVIRLYEDEAMLSRLAGEGKNLIREQFSTDAVWSIIEKDIAE